MASVASLAAGSTFTWTGSGSSVNPSPDLSGLIGEPPTAFGSNDWNDANAWSGPSGTPGIEDAVVFGPNIPRSPRSFDSQAVRSFSLNYTGNLFFDFVRDLGTVPFHFLVIQSGNLNRTGSGTHGFAGSIVNGASGTWNIDGNGEFRVYGQFSNPGTLIKTGSAGLGLQHGSSGGLAVREGTLRIAPGSGLSFQTGNITVGLPINSAAPYPLLDLNTGTASMIGTLSLVNGRTILRRTVQTSTLTLAGSYAELQLDSTQASPVSLINGSIALLDSADSDFRIVGGAGSSVQLPGTATTLSLTGQAGGRLLLDVPGMDVYQQFDLNRLRLALTAQANQRNNVQGRFRLNNAGVEFPGQTVVIDSRPFDAEGAYSLSADRIFAQDLQLSVPVIAGEQLTLSGSLQVNGVVHNTPGTLVLAGSTANSVSSLSVQSGTLRLNKSPNAHVVNPGAIVTVGSVGGSTSPVVEWRQDQQLPASASVRLHSGTLSLLQQSQSFADLQVYGGAVSGFEVRSSGSLSFDTGAPFTLDTNLAVDGDTIFHTAAGTDVTLARSLQGIATLVKTGPASLRIGRRATGLQPSAAVEVREGTFYADPSTDKPLGALTIGHVGQLAGANPTAVISALALGDLFNAGDLTFNGSGTLDLADNALRSLTINNGTADVTAGLIFVSTGLAGSGNLLLRSGTLDFRTPIGSVVNTTLSGALTGAGTVQFSDGIIQTFSGTAANSIANIEVEGGLLLLDKLPGQNAVGANLRVGASFGNGTFDDGTVRLLRDEQIDDAGTVTLAGTGVLDLNGKTETIGTLIARSSPDTTRNFSTGAGTLAFTRKIDALHSTNLSGRFGLAAQTVEAAVATDALLTISGSLDNGTLRKTGPGVLALNNVTGSAVLQLDDVGNLVAGNNTLRALRGDSDLLLFNSSLTVQPVGTALNSFTGAITGTGSFTVDGPGFQSLGGNTANTFNGGVTVRNGTLFLTKSSAIAVPRDIDVQQSAVVVTFGDGQFANNTRLTGNGSIFLAGTSQTLGSVDLGPGGLLTGGTGTPGLFASLAVLNGDVELEAANLTQIALTLSGGLGVTSNSLADITGVIGGLFSFIDDTSTLGVGAVPAGHALRFTQALILQSGATLNLRPEVPGAPALIDVGLALQITAPTARSLGVVDIDLQGVSQLANGTYALLDFDGAPYLGVYPTLGNFRLLPVSLNASLTIEQNVLLLNVVPEPASLSLLVGAASLMLRRRK